MSSAVFEVEVGEVVTLEFDFSREIEHQWQPGKVYSLNDYVRPRVPNGVEYQATTAGQSGSKEPRWPAIGSTESDGRGALVWTGVAFATNATDTISSHSVTADSGMDVDSSSVSGGSVLATLSGFDSKSCYDVVCEIVTSAGETLRKTLRIEVVN